MGIRLRIIHIVDKIEDKVIRHRWPWLCDWLAMHPWWRGHDCGKANCYPKPEEDYI